MLEIFPTLDELISPPFQRVNRSMTWKQSYCTFALLLRILEACFSDVKTEQNNRNKENRKRQYESVKWLSLRKRHLFYLLRNYLLIKILNNYENSFFFLKNKLTIQLRFNVFQIILELAFLRFLYIDLRICKSRTNNPDTRTMHLHTWSNVHVVGTYDVTHWSLIFVKWFECESYTISISFLCFQYPVLLLIFLSI